MNQTAKKLRDITQNAVVTPGSSKPYSVIATIKCAFGFDSISAAGVLLQFMAAIADELDELQAGAAGANNLRQQLESAEKKAERRKQHIGYLETALHDKNALLEQRGGTIARLTAENGKLRKQVPSERERQILDIWPKFEDGDPVWFGDKMNEVCGEVSHIYFDDDAISIYTGEFDHLYLSVGERVERHVQGPLGADGVEIKEGDTVWFRSFSTGNRMCRATVTGFGERNLDVRLATVEDEAGRTWNIDPKRITHTPPDSWERLERDTAKGLCEYFGFDDRPCDAGEGCPAYEQGICAVYKAKDIIRRAKALAGVGVD